MCVCVYVCMYVLRIMYVCVCMYVCTYYVCMYVLFMYVCVCMYVCTYVLCMYVCMHYVLRIIYVCIYYVLCMYVCHYRYLPYESGLLTIIMLATNQFVASSNRLAWPSSLQFVYTNCKRGGKTGRDNFQGQGAEGSRRNRMGGRELH